MQVLVCLANHVNEVLSKEELIREVWPDMYVTEDVLTRCISALRKSLDDDPKELKYNSILPFKDNEEAIRWWRKTRADRDPRMVWLRRYSPDHPLWNDPRFQQLIREMHFPSNGP